MVVEISEKPIEYIKQLEQYLSKCSKEELNQALAFWEKYKKEGEGMRDEFWKKWNDWKDEWYCKKFVYDVNSKKEFKKLILQYEDGREKFLEWLLPNEKELLKTFDDMMREKFYEEYLYDRILYSWNSKKRYNYEKLVCKGSFSRWVCDIKDDIKPWIYIDLSQYCNWSEWIELLAKEWKDSLKPWISINLTGQNCGVKWIEILARERKDRLQPWMDIYLSNNQIWNEWIGILARERKDSLQPWMSIELTRNNIWAEWIEVLAKEWKNTLKPWMSIFLSKNNLGDEWIKILARERKNSLRQWMSLWLTWNTIWDSGITAIMDNLELKDWVEILLSGDDDNVSDEMKQKLEVWIKSWHNKWVNCNVIYI